MIIVFLEFDAITESTTKQKSIQWNTTSFASKNDPEYYSPFPSDITNVVQVDWYANIVPISGTVKFDDVFPVDSVKSVIPGNTVSASYSNSGTSAGTKFTERYYFGIGVDTDGKIYTFGYIYSKYGSDDADYININAKINFLITFHMKSD